MKTTQQYTTPEVEIVEMNVEQGFSASSGADTDIGDNEGGGNLEDGGN